MPSPSKSAVLSSNTSVLFSSSISREIPFGSSFLLFSCGSVFSSDCSCNFSFSSFSSFSSFGSSFSSFSSSFSSFSSSLISSLISSSIFSCNSSSCATARIGTAVTARHTAAAMLIHFFQFILPLLHALLRTTAKPLYHPQKFYL